MTKWEKFKNWTSDNQEKIIAGAIIGGIVALYTGVCVYAYKTAPKLEDSGLLVDSDDNNRIWLVQEWSNGNILLSPTDDFETTES